MLITPNTLYNMDCLEGMSFIPDKSVDMILCDLPYGTTQCKWDTVIPFAPLWAHYERIIKDNGAIVLFAQTPFDKLLGASNIRLLRYEFIWFKNVATGHLNANRAPLKIHENVLVFYKKLPVYNKQLSFSKPYKNKRQPINDSGSCYNRIVRTDSVNLGERNPNTVLNFDREIGLHPTQKPVALCEYLIKTYTNKGMLVLDNCAGSGTTLIAALNTDRRFIGFEKDQEYHRIATERILNTITL